MRNAAKLGILSLSALGLVPRRRRPGRLRARRRGPGAGAALPPPGRLAAAAAGAAGERPAAAALPRRRRRSRRAGDGRADAALAAPAASASAAARADVRARSDVADARASAGRGDSISVTGSRAASPAAGKLDARRRPSTTVSARRGSRPAITVRPGRSRNPGCSPPATMTICSIPSSTLPMPAASSSAATCATCRALDTRRVLTVAVQDEAGRPVPFARVTITCADGNSLSLATVADGTAVFYPGLDRLGGRVRLGVAGRRPAGPSPSPRRRARSGRASPCARARRRSASSTCCWRSTRPAAWATRSPI